MLAGRTWESWIAEYAQSHQHPLNRLTHTLGIPMIVVSLILLAASFLFHGLLWWGAGLFIFGWALQFLGHAIEGKPAGVLQRLALPARRHPLVGRQDARQSVMFF